MLKKIISILICAVLLATPFCFGAAAEGESNAAVPQLTVSNTVGNPGDTVFVRIGIMNNPGICDLAFTLNFSKDDLEYKEYYTGALNDYRIYDHAKDGKIVVSSMNGKNIKKSDIIITFKFAVSKKAKIGESGLTLTKTYFATKKGKSVNVEIEKGKLSIQKPCSGEHSYLGDTTMVQKTCTRDEITALVCEKCGHTELETKPALGHTFKYDFTVDVVAENGKPGMISRHCKACGTKTNIILYTEDNNAALGINSLLPDISSTTLENLTYFFNGNKTYPDAPKDADIYSIYINDHDSINANGSINIAYAIDHILRKFFGGDRRSGIIGELKHADIAGELPLGLAGKLICSVF